MRYSYVVTGKAISFRGEQPTVHCIWSVSILDTKPLRFICEPIKAQFDKPPTLTKKPGCPDRFVWHGDTYQITEVLSEWHDYSRRGQRQHNMRPHRLVAAARRGSWGVGRDYYRIRTNTGRIFDIYYDRAPKSAADRKGAWFLYQEMPASGATH